MTSTSSIVGQAAASYRYKSFSLYIKASQFKPSYGHWNL